MTEIPLAPLDRIVRKAGAERVSISAAKALRESLEDIGRDISQRAIELSRHAGRKTVIAEDVKLAYNQWKR